MEKNQRMLELERIKKEKKEAKLKNKAIASQRERVHEEMDAYEKKHRKERKIAPKDSFISLQHVNKIYGNHVQAVYDFNLEIKKHEFIVFVGPSGCGKSTTLRMIAGLEDITAGDLYIDGVYANDLEPKNRDIAMVFQSYALYPHMTVAGNMSFGLKIRKIPTLMKDENGEPLKAIDNHQIKELSKEYKNLLEFKKECEKDEPQRIEQIDKDLKELSDKIEYLKVTPVDVYKDKHLTKEEIEKRVLNAANILEISEYLDRKPKALSGGQCQRVALGRAIVRNAKVFLMDEPLSNLDAKLRVQMRSEIVKLHNQLNATTIYVTHDQTEAMTMATRIVVMKKGYIQQIGTPIEIYNHPANLFVATFIGSPAMNLFKTKVTKNNICFDDGFKVELTKEQKANVKKFYESELISYKQEAKELLEHFKERNELLEKISVLEKANKTEKVENEIKTLKEQIEHVSSTNERLNFLNNAISKYELYLKDDVYDVTFGIRPEDIYEEGRVFTQEKTSEVINGKVNVAELLGHEYFVHVDFNNKDLIAKIQAKRLIDVNEQIKFVIDLSRAHIFDTVSTKVIF